MVALILGRPQKWVMEVRWRLERGAPAMVVGLADFDKAISHDGAGDCKEGEAGGACGGQAAGISQRWEPARRGSILDHWHVVHRLNDNTAPSAPWGKIAILTGVLRLLFMTVYVLIDFLGANQEALAGFHICRSNAKVKQLHKIDSDIR